MFRNPVVRTTLVLFVAAALLLGLMVGPAAALTGTVDPFNDTAIVVDGELI